MLCIVKLNEPEKVAVKLLIVPSKWEKKKKIFHCSKYRGEDAKAGRWRIL
jgi:hypothetical protein